MALYGKALADQIPSRTTGNQARLLFGQMTASLHNAYVKLKEFDSTGIGSRTGLDAGSVKAARDYLDNANGILQTYFLQMPASHNALTADQLQKLKVAVSTSSTAVNYIDENFGTGFLAEMFNAIGQALVDIPGAAASKIGSGVSDIVLNFLKETWWIILLAGGGLVGFMYIQGRAAQVAARAFHGAPRTRRRQKRIARR